MVGDLKIQNIKIIRQPDGAHCQNIIILCESIYSILYCTVKSKPLTYILYCTVKARLRNLKSIFFIGKYQLLFSSTSEEVESYSTSRE